MTPRLIRVSGLVGLAALTSLVGGCGAGAKSDPGARPGHGQVAAERYPSSPPQGAATEYLPGHCVTTPVDSGTGFKLYPCADPQRAIMDPRLMDAVENRWCPELAGEQVTDSRSTFYGSLAGGGHSGSASLILDGFGTDQIFVEFRANSSLALVRCGGHESDGQSTDPKLVNVDLATMKEVPGPPSPTK